MKNGKTFVKKNHLIKVVLAKFNKLTILSEIILICPLNKLYVKNIKDRYFCGEIFAISKAPIRAPKPSEDAKIPMLNSLNSSFSLPNTGINDTNGNPKTLKIRVVINTNLKLIKL